MPKGIQSLLAVLVLLILCCQLQHCKKAFCFAMEHSKKYYWILFSKYANVGFLSFCAKVLILTTTIKKKNVVKVVVVVEPARTGMDQIAKILLKN